MKALELRKKSVEEMKTLLHEKLLHREELIIALVQKKVKNVKELKYVKKDIARIRTLIAERH